MTATTSQRTSTEVLGLGGTLVAAAFGLLSSIVGVLVVKMKEEEDPMAALNRGFYLSALLSLGGMFGACYWLLRTPETGGGLVSGSFTGASPG